MQRPSFLKNRFIVSLPLRFPKVSVTSTNLLPSLIKKKSKTQNKRTCKQVKTDNQISTPAPSPSPPPKKMAKLNKINDKFVPNLPNLVNFTNHLYVYVIGHTPSGHFNIFQRFSISNKLQIKATERFKSSLPGNELKRRSGFNTLLSPTSYIYESSKSVTCRFSESPCSGNTWIVKKSDQYFFTTDLKQVQLQISIAVNHHNKKNKLLLFPGIFAAAQIVLPKDCKGNIFCEIVKIIVGPTVKWYITGHFQWKNIRVATGFANVRIFDGLYFHKLELYVEVSCQEGDR